MERGPGSSRAVHYSIGLLMFGSIGGILLGLVTQVALRGTETTEFCTSCHVMEATVFEEFKKTAHYMNASGIRATCADCHIPSSRHPGRQMAYLSTKLGAVRFLYGWATGTVSEPEQLLAKREVLARRVWDRMRSSNSRECRSCHAIEAMDLSMQATRAREQHRSAEEEGKSCIDCHDDGIAHAPQIVKAQPEEDLDSVDFMLD